MLRTEPIFKVFAPRLAAGDSLNTYSKDPMKPAATIE